MVAKVVAGAVGAALAVAVTIGAVAALTPKADAPPSHTQLVQYADE